MPTQLAVPVPDRSSLMAPGARIGIDLVQVSAIERSLADFGSRFSGRLFAPGELRDSTRDGRLDARRLAARFAAKEAAIKAFDLAQAGVGWAQIEVTDCDEAAGRVRLHGRAAASIRDLGMYEIALSLSNDGDLACAIVVALPARAGQAAGMDRALGKEASSSTRRSACDATTRSNEQQPETCTP
jgi:holo-[acyl-carrier protein] synthase